MIYFILFPTVRLYAGAYRSRWQGDRAVVGNNDLEDVLQPVEQNVVEGLVLKSTYISERIEGQV